MKDGSDYSQGMTLRTRQGEAKYLDTRERARFYAALDCLTCEVDRTFCEMIFWTGCRPSEALALCIHNIDIQAGFVAVRSLKKRGRQKGRLYRHVPLPRAFLERLDKAHGISAAQAVNDNGAFSRLWSFGRTTGWKRKKAVMTAAGISGVRACARGLRHSFGVHASLSGVPETRIKTWLGHSRLSTTEIYLDLAAPEDRAMMERMWAGLQPSQGGTPTHTGLDSGIVIEGASTHEVVRVVNAFSAIRDAGKRLEFLGTVEACVESQPQSAERHNHAI